MTSVNIVHKYILKQYQILDKTPANQADLACKGLGLFAF